MRWDFSLQTLVFQTFQKAFGGLNLDLQSSQWLRHCSGAGVGGGVLRGVPLFHLLMPVVRGGGSIVRGRENGCWAEKVDVLYKS